MSTPIEAALSTVPTVVGHKSNHGTCIVEGGSIDLEKYRDVIVAWLKENNVVISLQKNEKKTFIHWSGSIQADTIPNNSAIDRSAKAEQFIGILVQVYRLLEIQDALTKCMSASLAKELVGRVAGYGSIIGLKETLISTDTLLSEAYRIGEKTQEGGRKSASLKHGDRSVREAQDQRVRGDVRALRATGLTYSAATERVAAKEGLTGRGLRKRWGSLGKESTEPAK